MLRRRDASQAGDELTGIATSVWVIVADERAPLPAPFRVIAACHRPSHRPQCGGH